MRCHLFDVKSLPSDVIYLFSDEKKPSSLLMTELFTENDIPAGLFYRASGQPYGVSDNNEFPVSVSHVQNYTLVCAKKSGFLGADVQTKVAWTEEKQIIAFAERERALAENKGERLDFLWAAKEALLKAVGVGLGKGYSYVEILSDFSTYCDVFFKNGEEKIFLHPAIFRLPWEKGCCLIFAADCATIKK